MTIPTKTADYMMTGLVRISSDYVLDRTRKQVAIMRKAWIGLRNIK